ncbi:MAG TPA: hypothetical protein VN943_00010 [Candidatus Acidoferrum sp.]|nr:hypothetical protein [Candidatus Acidoferrum sp.]
MKKLNREYTEEMRGLDYELKRQEDVMTMDQEKIQAYTQGAMHSIARMLEGRHRGFPLTVTISDPKGLIGRLRVPEMARAPVDPVEEVWRRYVPQHRYLR